MAIAAAAVVIATRISALRDVEKRRTSHDGKTSTEFTNYDLEKSRTGAEVQRTVNGQAQSDADDNQPKTFVACLAIEFL